MSTKKSESTVIALDKEAQRSAYIGERGNAICAD